MTPPAFGPVSLAFIVRMDAGLTVMQSFIYALLLAGVSGVTVIAFKHPIGYARLFPYLVTLVTFVFVGVSIWQVAVETTWQSVDQFIDQKLNDEAVARKSELNLPVGWVMFWYAATISFLWINLKLPPFLQVTDHMDSSSKKENSRP